MALQMEFCEKNAGNLIKSFRSFGPGQRNSKISIKLENEND